MRHRFAACRCVEEMTSFRQPYPRSFKCKTTAVRPVKADRNLMARHKEIFAVALFGKKVEVKEFRNRLGVAQRVPGGLGSQIS